MRRLLLLLVIWAGATVILAGATVFSEGPAVVSEGPAVLRLGTSASSKATVAQRGGRSVIKVAAAHTRRGS